MNWEQIYPGRFRYDDNLHAFNYIIDKENDFLLVGPSTKIRVEYYPLNWICI